VALLQLASNLAAPFAAVTASSVPTPSWTATSTTKSTSSSVVFIMQDHGPATTEPSSAPSKSATIGAGTIIPFALGSTIYATSGSVSGGAAVNLPQIQKQSLHFHH
jgi:hypothetical protein